MNWRGMLETFTVTLSAIVLSLVLFAIFILATKGVSPVDLYAAIYKGGFGTATSWENCLKLAAPLMLTALCTALPARLGLINIGGEGALILGGLAAAITGVVLTGTGTPIYHNSLAVVVALLVSGLVIGGLAVWTKKSYSLFRVSSLAVCGTLLLGGWVYLLRALDLYGESIGLHFPALPFPLPQVGMLLFAMLAGGLLIAIVGGLSHWRGVNATICSLLLYYIALGLFKFLVEGPFRDPASLNKPSTVPITADAYIGDIGFLSKHFEIDVHWGLAFGIIACLLAYILMDHSTFGFAARMTGGNVRAAQATGLPVGRLILVTCFLGGAAAGLAGGIQIAVAEHQANAALYAQKFGFTGILIAFIARHHPLAIIPTAILFGGLKTASDTLQARFELPDASTDVLAGTAVMIILAFETFYARYRVFQARAAADKPPPAGAALSGEATAQVVKAPA